jgi:hypothetical protein
MIFRQKKLNKTWSNNMSKNKKNDILFRKDGVYRYEMFWSTYAYDTNKNN